MSRWILYLSLSFSLSVAYSHALGVQPASGGRVTLDGKRYAGIGVNYFNAFYRRLILSSDTSYREGFRELGKHNIPFARISISGFWPSQNHLFDDDPSRYFEYLDDVVKSAAENNVGLIFSFFWAHFCIPDYVGEPVSKWGDSTSKTHAYMRRFTGDVVKHYLDNPTVWGWEFGNEYNLVVDFPAGSEVRPAIQPTLGTPASRSASDDITTDILATALREFGKEIRKQDTTRMIFSGNSLPRPSAWHQQHEKSWGQDTRPQFSEVMAAQNPSPLQSLTIHIYSDSVGKLQLGDLFVGENLRLPAAIHACDSLARKLNRPLFFGEFGAEAQASTAVQKSWLNLNLNAILKDTIPLSAVWVFDLKQQEGSWNITGTNGRTWILEEIAKANLTLAKNVGRSSGLQAPRLDRKTGYKNGPAWGPFYNLVGQRLKKALAFFR